MASISEQEKTKLGRTSRRQWLSAIAGTIGFGFAVAALSRYMRPNAPAHGRTVNLGNIDTLLSGGTQRAVNAEGSPLVVVRPASAPAYALLMKCTHAGCPLTLKTNKIHCGCHGGVFDLQGNPESGPPKKPLTRLPMWVSDDTVYVRLPGKPEA